VSAPQERGLEKHEDERGFALIIVLWFLVLLGSIGIALIVHGRSETAIAHNVRAAADAEALADDGIARAAFNLLDPVPANRWPFDGSSHRINLPAGYVSVQIEDETNKINPNLARPELLAGLFEAVGFDRNRARHLGGATADWVSDDGDPSEFGAKADQYRAAGKNYGPPNAPFETLDDLNLVLGMTPDAVARVRPYLTLYTSTNEPNVKGAPAVIQRAMTLDRLFSGGANGGDGDDSDSDTDSDTAQPKQAAAPGAPGAASGQGKAEDERVVGIDAIGHSRDGGVYVRHAVLHLPSSNAQGYDVLDWQRGSLPDQVPGEAAGALSR
jgi:general secretion pathway protein K